MKPAWIVVLALTCHLTAAARPDPTPSFLFVDGSERLSRRIDCAAWRDRPGFAIAVLAEAALSFLGFGTPPPTPSWGRMLQESQELLFTAPRLAVFPGVAIAVAVLGFNLLGDGLQDMLDPRRRRA